RGSDIAPIRARPSGAWAAPGAAVAACILARARAALRGPLLIVVSSGRLLLTSGREAPKSPCGNPDHPAHSPEARSAGTTTAPHTPARPRAPTVTPSRRASRHDQRGDRHRHAARPHDSPSTTAPAVVGVCGQTKHTRSPFP